MQAIDIRPEWGAEKKGKRHFFSFLETVAAHKQLPAILFLFSRNFLAQAFLDSKLQEKEILAKLFDWGKSECKRSRVPRNNSEKRENEAKSQIRRAAVCSPGGRRASPGAGGRKPWRPWRRGPRRRRRSRSRRAAGAARTRARGSRRRRSRSRTRRRRTWWRAAAMRPRGAAAAAAAAAARSLFSFFFTSRVSPRGGERSRGVRELSSCASRPILSCGGGLLGPGQRSGRRLAAVFTPAG